MVLILYWQHKKKSYPESRQCTVAADAFRENKRGVLTAFFYFRLNANTAACQGRWSDVVNDRSLSSLLELLLRGGIRQMEGQTGGQSATPQNVCNIDERDGRMRKGGMTYSSGDCVFKSAAVTASR